MRQTVLATIYSLVFLVPISTSFARVPKDETMRAVHVLEGMHYSQDRLLNDSKGNSSVGRFMESLDPGKYNFSKEDFSVLAEKYKDTIDDDVRRGDLSAANEIFSLFRTRAQERVAMAEGILDSASQFPADEDAEIRSSEAEWASEAEMPVIWKKRIHAEILREMERDKSFEKSKKNIKNRYDRFLADLGSDAAMAEELFLGAVCQSYDPHTEYLGAEGMSEFDISMQLQLCGIGVVLNQENGVVKVESVVPGGPAANDGRMRKGDQIVGVGAREDIENVGGLRIDKIVRKIRGKRGTEVSLELLREGEGTVTVTLVRDDVQLNNQAARGGVIDLSDGRKIGIISIPSFYYDGNGRSVSADLKSILTAMKTMGVEAIVVDLRQDGGGSLEESIRAAGLFIPDLPVVQIRDRDGGVITRRAPNEGETWRGPLVVLIDRSSASASEIFAAAIQDHKAGILVGDSRTFGKGTVQALVDLSPSGLMRFIAPERKKSGHIKLTIQKFYRANGESTQAKGVESDIRVPSITDIEGGGETGLDNHLPHSRIPAAQSGEGPVTDALVDSLENESEKRISSNPIFEETERRRKRAEAMRDKNLLPISREEEFPHKNHFLKSSAEIITTLRGAEIEVEKGDLADLYSGGPMKTAGGEEGDPVLEEAVSIARDWVQSGGTESRLGMESPAQTTEPAGNNQSSVSIKD
jgi:carboxyl-terminal processing protease